MKALIASTTLAILTVLAPAQSAAEKLVETMQIRKELGISFKAAMQPTLQAMKQQLGLDEAQAKELNEIYGSWWDNDIDQDAIVSEYARLYSETFSEEEIKELTAFYGTPLGKKVLKQTPNLTAAGVKIGAAAAEGKRADLISKLQAFQARVEAGKAPAEEASPKEAPAAKE